MITLTEKLALEELAPDQFQNANPSDGWVSIYGGQVIAQALWAASRTVADDRRAHSLHAYFLRPGKFDRPIVFEVHRDRDGGKFSARRVVASQDGVPILTLQTSFHVAEEGPSHCTALAPSVPMPETLTPTRTVLPKGGPKSDKPQLSSMEIRPIVGCSPFEKEAGGPEGMAWFRIEGAGSNDPVMNRVMLAYISDMFLIYTAVRPHRKEIGLKAMVASIDHALWFHDEFSSDEWLLYVQDSPWANHARGLTRGMIYTRDGRLIASVAQEGLLRKG